MPHSRDKRIAEAIRQALTSAVMYELSDPRRPPIMTITEVIVSKDLRHARVWYSQIPDDEEAVEETGAMFGDCAGYLRSIVARDVNLKYTPELEFRYDSSPKEFQKIDRKLKEINREESSRAWPQDASEDEE